jgi:hypothetical protein
MDDGEARQERSVDLNRYGPLITFCELVMWKHVGKKREILCRSRTTYLPGRLGSGPDFV